MPRRGKGSKVDMNPTPFFFNGKKVPRKLLLSVVKGVSEYQGWSSRLFRQMRGQILNDPVGVGRYLVKHGYLHAIVNMEVKHGVYEDQAIIRIPVRSCVRRMDDAWTISLHDAEIV